MNTVNKTWPWLALIGLLPTAAATAGERQSLDGAWWTGPILAAGAGTLPQGHALVEPYFYDVVRYGRTTAMVTNETRRAPITTDR